MSILHADRRQAKFSTLKPRRRTGHEFGLGILPVETSTAPTNRVSGFFAGRTPAPSAEQDGIPSSVTRIALVRGDERHVYTRAGERWLRETDGSPIWATSADQAFRRGMVAILLDAPAKVERAISPMGEKPSPRPARRGPSAEDVAFESGRTIGLEAGLPVEAPAHYSPAERAAFRNGMAEAGAILQARHDDHLADLELQARWDGLEDVEAHDRAEAGIYLPPVFVD